MSQYTSKNTAPRIEDMFKDMLKSVIITKHNDYSESLKQPNTEDYEVSSIFASLRMSYINYFCSGEYYEVIRNDNLKIKLVYLCMWMEHMISKISNVDLYSPTCAINLEISMDIHQMFVDLFGDYSINISHYIRYIWENQHIIDKFSLTNKKLNLLVNLQITALITTSIRVYETITSSVISRQTINVSMNAVLEQKYRNLIHGLHEYYLYTRLMINRYKITAIHFKKIGDFDFVNKAICVVDSTFSTSIDYSKFI